VSIHTIYRERDKPRQGAVANTPKLFRNGAVGFIDWLDRSCANACESSPTGGSVACSETSNDHSKQSSNRRWAYNDDSRELRVDFVVIVDADTCDKVASDDSDKEDEQNRDHATRCNGAEGEALPAKNCELNEPGGNRQPEQSTEDDNAHDALKV
jgi:hypothetical protein